MLNIKGYAVRKNGTINVTVSGDLANSCYTATIDDKYPGGNIVYIKDPGSAQVFIEEIMKQDSDICLFALLPWVGHINIIDSDHDTVTIFINGNPVATTDIVDIKHKEIDSLKYQVIALSGSNRQGCSVIPADAAYPAIYSPVFGPQSKDACEGWMADNCGKNADELP